MGIIETIKLITREEGREEGIKEGQELKNQEFVRSLLISTDFDAAKIASLVGVEVSFVEDLKKELGRK